MINQDKLKPITDEALRQITVNHLGEVKFNGANNCADIATTVNAMLARIRTDAAEIKRLREALEYISLCIPESTEYEINELEHMINSMLGIARAALKGGE